MKIKEIRSLSTDELKKRIFSLHEYLNKNRIKKEIGQLENDNEIKKIKKDIARFYTVLRERDLNTKNEAIKKVTNNE